MDHGNKKRLFLAFNLPPEIKAVLGSAVSGIKNTSSGINWVDQKNYHITLVFIGDARVDETVAALQSLEGRYRPYEFFLDETGYLPDSRNPRIIYCGCREKGTGAAAFQAALKRKITGAGNSGKKWIPHVTLGRLKRPEILPDFPALPNLAFAVDTFELMESALDPKGPVYRVAESFSLGNL